MSTNKNELLELIQKLPEDQTEKAKIYIKSLIEKKQTQFEKSINNAKEVEECLTEGEIKAIEDARREIKAGKAFTQDEMDRLMGLW